MTAGPPPPIHLSSGPTSVIVDVVAGQLRIPYWGPALGPFPVDDVLAAIDRPAPEAEVDLVAPLALLPEAGSGFVRAPGLTGRRPDGTGWAPRLRVTRLDHATDSTPTDRAAPAGASVSATLADPQAGLEVEVMVRVTGSGAVELDATVHNTGPDHYELAGLLLTVPVPGQAREVMLLGGRWGNEFRPERHPWSAGTVSAENRRGRTSHDRLPVLFAGTAGFCEESGEVWAVHLAWSGNSMVRADLGSDGQRMLQVGEILLPGEVVLDPGASHRAPTVVAAASTTGLNGISRRFHQYLRSRPSHPRGVRPVILNSWEAVYFNHDLDRLRALADKAAAVGVERFVLDDGWFGGRRHDGAGLGDWHVDLEVWPDGLDPLIEHVRRLGMDFGLWVEPEMVNPDSDLYRAHPDWVLHDPAYQPALARKQLVLDLTRPEVFDHLLGRLDSLLAGHDIGYLKWDLNRDLPAPAHHGRPGARQQTLALYRLIDELRAAHPGVEIESCSSGGARADFAILERTQRIWTSDCNDALDRQRIQRGFSYLFPPEVMGAHVGSSRDHLTGRQHRLDFRAITALFGHMGIEWDLTTASEVDLAQLTRIIEVHKQHRDLIHHGLVVRLDHPDPAILAQGVVAPDRSRALVSVAQMATADTLPVAPIRLAGLDPERPYRITRVDVGEQRLGKAKYQPRWLADGVSLSGRQLGAVGIQPPVLDPQSAIVLSVVGE